MLQPRSGALVVLRTVFIAFVSMPLAVLIAFSFVDVTESRLGTGTAIAILAAVGGMTVSLVGLFKKRLLRGETSTEVASSYRTSMFVLLVLSETIVIVGAVLFFLSGSLLTYVVAVVLAVPAYAQAAPTGRDISRQQELLNGRGVNADLLGGLLEGRV
jgi:hypothetical protein